MLHKLLTGVNVVSITLSNNINAKWEYTSEIAKAVISDSSNSVRNRSAL